ncbi:trans-Golgi network integral membrane protein TGN38-like isoform X2 [Anoplophora glabripennis]|uniref:trans-Golgi network integral membrane protein TGN38-like isoform X2 n=1 Tax=Anoplophora glabripennis TaxID=217634 RepID=UPI000873C77B|nr:trans-Golgi network integral membrane protein TGN38-like isoform X2 [Anoplophora glabripennis]
MALSAILYLLLGLVTLNAKNLPPENFYDVLVKNCPILNMNEKSFKNQDIFNKCKTWKEISETKTLTNESAQNVLCLLYYDAFISFCDEINTKKTFNKINLVPDVKDYKAESVCKNSSLFPASRIFKHNVDKIISTEGICYKLCQNFDGTLVNECSLAYYFANYVSSPTKAIKPDLQQLESNPKEVNSDSIGNALNIEVESPKTKEILNADNNSPKPKADQVPNNNAVVKQDSDKNGDNAMLKKNPESTSNNGLENINVPKSDPDNVKDSELVANSNPVAANNENSANLNVANDESQTKAKLKAKEEVHFKKETEANDATQVTNEIPSDEEFEKQSQIQSNTEKNLGENQPDVPEGEPKQGDGNKNEVDDIDPVDAQNLNEEGSDGNYKSEEGTQVNKNGKLKEALTMQKDKEKPNTLAEEMPANYNTAEELDGESYFFSYFMVICVLFVLGYVGYHNRQKVMALMLEGKRGKRQVRGRRPNSANYHKLDSNLEEAISSTCTKNSSHVIY